MTKETYTLGTEGMLAFLPPAVARQMGDDASQNGYARVGPRTAGYVRAIVAWG